VCCIFHVLILHFFCLLQGFFLCVPFPLSHPSLLYSKASFVFRSLLYITLHQSFFHVPLSLSHSSTPFYYTPKLLSCFAFLVLFICILSPFAPLKLLSCVPLSLSYLPLSLHQSFFRMFIMFPSTSFACSIFITLFITHLSPSKLLSYVYHVFFHFYRVYPCLSKKLTTVTSILFIPIYFDQLLPSCFLFLLPQLPQIWIFVAINFKILPQIYYSFSSSVLIYIYIYYFFRLYKKK
jgi:hypothetical protein